MPQGSLNSFLSSPPPPPKGGRNLSMPPSKLGKKIKKKKEGYKPNDSECSLFRLALIFVSGSLKPSLTVLNSSPHILLQLIMLSF